MTNPGDTTMKLDRSFYIVQGATKVSDKLSTAVAYVYERNGKPYAQMFEGKSAKPAHHYSYTNAARREQCVKNFFDIVRGHEARRAEQRAAKKAKLAGGHKVQVGHVMVSSWGYDQTNVDYYQVVALVGRRSVQVRRIGSTLSEGDAMHSGKSVPLIDSFHGDVTTHRVNEHGGIKIGHQYASIWEGRPMFCSFYA